MKNLSWRKIGLWFTISYLAWAVLIYVLVTVVPLYAISCGIVLAACQSGNVWVLFASQWILPIFIGMFTSPLIVDYIKTKKELKMLKDANAEEADADR